MPETVCAFSTLLDRLPLTQFEFISQNFDPFAASLAGTRFQDYPVVIAPRAIAAVVAAIAHELLDGGGPCDPASLDANYVRRSDAELLYKPNC